MKNEVYYYDSYDDDFVTSKKQNLILKKNFKWIHKNVFYKFGSFLCHIFFIILSFIYCKFVLKVKFVNKKILKGKNSYFLFANHTQEIGDVLNPVLVTFPVHPYFVCSPANFGIPFIGKILPMAGGLPISDNIHDLKKLKDAISYYIKRKKAIIIYPEAHLWPWCTFIRPFPNTSFHFPVDLQSPVYVATTTYQKSRKGKKPRIIVYFDGPFLSKQSLSRKEQIGKLHDQVFKTMEERSKKSNYEFIKYKKKD